MTPLPTDLSTLCGVVLLLGMLHGLDADHLATIDGLTRINAAAGRRFAAGCGALFSLGHGGIVMAVALLVAGTRAHWQAPAWLDTVGAALSIMCLLVLGLVNLLTAWRAAPGALVATVGLKGRLLGRWRTAQHPWAAAGAGALFALSFDTLGQTALFALAAAATGGVAHAALLATLFTLGMLLTDGLNGLWVARMLARADELAARTSRTMGLAVGAISLLAAAYGFGRLLQLWDGGPAWLAGAVIAASVFASYIIARHIERPRAATASNPPLPA